jgi:hypothetical protein
MIAVPAISMPVALLSSQAANAAPGVGATALETAQSQAGVVLTITSMTPRQAGPGSTITVTGKLRNASQHQLSQLTVQLLSSVTPVSSVTEIQDGASEPYVLAADRSLPGASWQTAGQLQPGASVGWSIHVKAKALGMTTFGAYPLVAQAQSTQTQSTLAGQPLATATTYLPYTPAKKGQYGSSIPARTKISWVWPLIDKPLTAAGQSACHAPQAQALAASLGSAGRLGRLVAGAVNGARAAITWAIDPALLGDVKALAACRSSQPKWATAASSWLKRVRELSAAQPVFVTPYGDSNVAALIGAQHAGDVGNAFAVGGSIGGSVLDRNLSAGSATSRPTADGPTAEGQTASIAWPAGGIPGGSAGYSVLENLLADRVQTLLLQSSYVPGNRATVLRTPDNGRYMKLLLANESLTRLLATGGSTADSDFATAQEFLAATALLAAQHPGQPILVAPPQRWDPAQGLAAGLLAVTGSASWLSPASLTSLASGKKIPVLTPLPSEGRQRMLNGTEARVLRRVDGALAKLELLRAKPDPDDYLPMLAAESSAWQDTPKVALGGLRALEQRIRRQLTQGVQIEAEQRFTLGGLKGSVPVSIDNTLNYAVAVRLRLHVDSSRSGTTITVSPGGAVSRSGLVTIASHNVVTVRLRVQATDVGATTVTMRLENRQGDALLGSSAQQMTLQATQVGVLGVIIFAVALGIFLIATAARAARRGRLAPAAEQATDAGLPAEHADVGPAVPPEADTVMAERTELGAAGAPGRD